MKVLLINTEMHLKHCTTVQIHIKSEEECGDNMISADVIVTKY